MVRAIVVKGRRLLSGIEIRDVAVFVDILSGAVQNAKRGGLRSASFSALMI